MIATTQFARDMKRADETAVDALLQAAFGGTDEVKLVQRLRRSGRIAGEQVMPMGDRIVGYYALSHLVAPTGWLALAPVAIAPDVQGRGYGKRMIGMLSEWARLTQTPVVVVGDPKFYTRAGFDASNAQQFESPYPVAVTAVAGIAERKPAVLKYGCEFDGV